MIDRSSFFLNRIAYYIAGVAAAAYVLSYFLPFLFLVGHIILVLLAISIFVDMILLYGKSKGIQSKRITAERFSNGDQNKVLLQIANDYSFPVMLSVIDELPVQFQERNWMRKLKIDAGKNSEI